MKWKMTDFETPFSSITQLDEISNDARKAASGTPVDKDGRAGSSKVWTLLVINRLRML